QQTRSRESIYGDLATRRSSFWEYEAIANHYGGAAFQHQACVTDSILKATHAKFLKNGSTEVTIKAHGFRTEKRVEYVKVFGRDGKYHPVPVYWDEYLPVQKESQILVMEKAEPEDNEGRKQVNAVVSGWKDRYEDLICRRSVYACRK
ncbi:MAG: hypothetical protein J6Q65_06465, partial [Lentisphaeria bacterium]|nr:hypothetical protein [Lentisphaeria bacterium]